jgi:hypothetical protein
VRSRYSFPGLLREVRTDGSTPEDYAPNPASVSRGDALAPQPAVSIKLSSYHLCSGEIHNGMLSARSPQVK